MKIISGGQTGIDRLALEIAKSLEHETGGTAPKDFRTEIGSDYSLQRRFGLVEGNTRSYPPRTWKNVADADATLWIGPGDTSGFLCTRTACEALAKPFLVYEEKDADPLLTKTMLRSSGWTVINIAGPRGSRCSPGLTRFAKLFLLEILR